MPHTAATRDDRRVTNPIFNQRKLKLGTFQSNLDYGCLMSDVEGRLQISWANTVALAKLADEMEFEALLPVARWRGFGGRLNPQGRGFETYTWASGIAALTQNAGVVATSHCSVNHPITAAKQSAAIDHISNGRYILNIVTGWNKPEIDMFGAEMRPHDERYDMAEEWLNVVKRLWTEDEFDHDGKYYKIVKGYLQPKPIQQPYPAIMNAGGSERGRHFACKYCDLALSRWVRQALSRTKRKWKHTASSPGRNTVARSRSGHRRISSKRRPRPRRVAIPTMSCTKRATGRRSPTRSIHSD